MWLAEARTELPRSRFTAQALNHPAVRALLSLKQQHENDVERTYRRRQQTRHWGLREMSTDVHQDRHPGDTSLHLKELCPCSWCPWFIPSTEHSEGGAAQASPLKAPQEPIKLLLLRFRRSPANSTLCSGSAGDQPSSPFREACRQLIYLPRQVENCLGSSTGQLKAPLKWR